MNDVFKYSSYIKPKLIKYIKYIKLFKLESQRTREEFRFRQAYIFTGKLFLITVLTHTEKC